MMKLTALFVIIFAIALSSQSRAEDCAVYGQFIVDVKPFDKTKEPAIYSCGSSVFPGGGLISGGFSSNELNDPLDKYKGDPKFMNALKNLGLGDDYQSVRRNIAQSSSGKIRILGGTSDLADLNYVGGKLNDFYGITEKVTAIKARQIQDDEAKKKRNSTAVEFSPNSITDAVNINAPISNALTTGSCDTNAGKETPLKIFKIHFADNEEAAMIPRSIRKTGENEYEFESPAYGKVFGGPVIIPGSIVRKLRFENGKAIWISGDQEYPIASVTQMNSNEVLNPIRNFGAGGAPDSCIYMGVLKDHTQITPFPKAAPGGKVN